MSLSSKEYFIRETGKSIKRNGIMSFASVSTVAVSLLVLGLFLLMYLNTDNLAKYLEGQVEMTVYLEDTATGEEVAEMREKLKKMEGVVQVTEVTKAMAMERFKNRLGDQATLLKALGKDKSGSRRWCPRWSTGQRLKQQNLDRKWWNTSLPLPR